MDADDTWNVLRLTIQTNDMRISKGLKNIMKLSRTSRSVFFRYSLSMIVGCCLFFIGCDGGESNFQPQLVSISIISEADTVQVGESIQLIARGTYIDNSTQDITDKVSWTSSDELIAAIGATGMLSAIKGGKVTISADLNDLDSSININVNVDTWSISIVGEYALEAECIRQTSDGGFILTGRQQSENQSWDIYLLKLDKFGNILWETTFGSSGDDRGNNVTEVNATYIVAGQIAISDTTSDIYLVCTDSSGNMLWEKTIGGPYNDAANAIRTTTDGNLIIAGSTEKLSEITNEKDFDVYLAKIDQNGNLIWDITIVDPFEGYNSDDIARSVRQVSEGGYIIAGSIHNVDVFENAYVLRVDDDGTLIWQKSIGESWSYENGYDGLETSLGGFIIVGSIENDLGANNYGCFSIKIDKDGKQEWMKNYFAMVFDSRYAIAPASNLSRYTIAGVTFGHNTGSRDIVLFEIDDYGEIIWEKIYGNQGNDFAVSLQKAIDGGYIVAGNSKSDDIETIMILKTNENGDIDSLTTNPN